MGRAITRRTHGRRPPAAGRPPRRDETRETPVTTTARHLSGRIRIPRQAAPGGAPSAGEPAPAADAPLTSEPPCADLAPLTSEPPLAGAAPLTSEPPLTGAAPLTSEPTAPGGRCGTESPGV
ncbi:hypothetical protein Shyd_23440 [Streptomyces hydrogenans]|uniref:Uncharacterized protein n=2 Tax=Streptomyces hydrogenans TaxID=1873719 RepID=A0ABQ3P7H4_9ACTN|nr:hypothetical protein GCM10018784_15260 [Streptomyces hydrogenans]GHI20973.1 hypothetical protein Shyd_23440 [Streptomyces hydrogenans]